MDIVIPRFKRAPKEPQGFETTTPTRSALTLGARTHALQTLYREQPAVQTVVGFLARNVGQVPLQAFQRGKDDSRERLSANNPVSRFVRRPNWDVTTYTWVHELVADVAVFGNAYGIKVKDGKGKLIAVVRVPPYMVSLQSDSIDGPPKYVVSYPSGQVSYALDEVFHVRMYSPDPTRVGVSPLESCRAMLAEDAASTKAREQFWKNGAQYSDVFERPLDAPEWSDKARNRFIEQIKNRFTNEAEASGAPLVLEEGISRVGGGASPRDAEYVAGRQLTLGFVASVYGIPQQLIGASATDRNWSEAHRALYQDLLPPWTTLIEQEVERQLLPDLVGDQAVDGRVYVEFNLEAKLRGSFREQAEVLQSAVGGPFMTANEARKLQGLPPVAGGDTLNAGGPAV